MSEDDGGKMFFWDHTVVNAYSYIIAIPDFPRFLIPAGYTFDGHTVAIDFREPEKFRLPKCVIAAPHDWIYEHRIDADGVYHEGDSGKLMIDQMYKLMHKASNSWLKRQLRYHRYYAIRHSRKIKAAWHDRIFPKPLKPQWEHMFGDRQLQRLLPTVSLHAQTGRLMIEPPRNTV